MYKQRATKKLLDKRYCLWYNSCMAESELKPCLPKELNPPLNVTVISDVAGLERVASFFKRKSVFTIDVETNVVPNFFLRKLRTIQVGDRDEQYVIDLLPFVAGYTATEGTTLDSGMGNYKWHNCFNPIAAVLRPALESKDWLKLGHNLQFDYETYSKHEHVQ